MASHRTPTVPHSEAQRSNLGGKPDTPSSAVQNAAIDARIMLDEGGELALRILERARRKIYAVALEAEAELSAAQAELREKNAARFRIAS